MVEHKSLAAAVSALQGELPVVEKLNKANAGAGRSYKWADLTLLTEKVMPLLSKHGLAFISYPNYADGVFGLSFQLVHESGGEIAGHYPLPDNGKPQDIGSAITYARRYALAAVTGVAPGGDDDDAQKAQAAAVKPQPVAAVPAGYLDRLDAAVSIEELQALWNEAGQGGFVTPEVTALKDRVKARLAS